MGVQGWGGVGSGRVVLIDNGRVYQSKAADALVQVKTTKFGTNVGLNMLLNISSRYFWGLFWSRQLRGLPSSDGYFYTPAPPKLEWGYTGFTLMPVRLSVDKASGLKNKQNEYQLNSFHAWHLPLWGECLYPYSFLCY